MHKTAAIQILFILLSLTIFAGTILARTAADDAVIAVLQFHEGEFEQTEIEDDQFFTSISSFSLTGLIFTKHRSKNLGQPVACVLPGSPPPKIT